MKNRKQKEQKFRKNIQKSIVMSQKDKDFWLKKISLLPDVILEKVLQAVESKNEVVDQYYDAALKNDPEGKYVSAFKAKIQSSKKKAFALDNKAEGDAAEADLQKQIQNL